MPTQFVTLTIVACLAMVARPVGAHPGGTDRYGCHVESATGLRHCHNGSGAEGEEVNFLATAATGVELGRQIGARLLARYTAFGAAYLHHDGTMNFMFGVAAHSAATHPGKVYADASVGAAWLAQEQVFFAIRVSGGVRFDLLPLWSEVSNVHIKLGLFFQGIVDDVNAEPIGAEVVLGVSF